MTWWWWGWKGGPRERWVEDWMRCSLSEENELTHSCQWSIHDQELRMYFLQPLKAPECTSCSHMWPHKQVSSPLTWLPTAGYLWSEAELKHSSCLAGVSSLHFRCARSGKCWSLDSDATPMKQTHCFPVSEPLLLWPHMCTHIHTSSYHSEHNYIYRATDIGLWHQYCILIEGY